jgi:hypothetical protein
MTWNTHIVTGKKKDGTPIHIEYPFTTSGPPMYSPFLLSSGSLLSGDSISHVEIHHKNGNVARHEVRPGKPKPELLPKHIRPITAEDQQEDPYTYEILGVDGSVTDVW